MNSTMIQEARELAGWNAKIEALSVYQALMNLTDTRGKQGKRSSFALVLTCVLLAKMAGETTLQAITDWIRYRNGWLRQVPLLIRFITIWLEALNNFLAEQRGSCYEP